MAETVLDVKIPEEYDRFSFSTKLLIREALKRGIGIEQIGSATGLFLLTLGDHQEYLYQQWTSQFGAMGVRMARNKHLFKRVMQRAGISVPDGVRVRKVSTAMRWVEEHGGFPIVMKPVVGTHGDSVHVGVGNMAAMGQLLERIQDETNEAVLIEEQFEGTEYRLFATREKFLAATNRVPANVTGDGEHTISQLIDIKNQDPNRSAPGRSYRTALLQIPVDDVVMEYLERHGRSLSDVPAKDENVQLRSNSNLSTGGDSVDVTDEVHDDVKKIAVEIMQSLPGVPYAGIDFMTKDVTKPQTNETHVIIEVNFTPMLSMHHFPAVGQQRDVTKVLIEDLFPELKEAA